MKAFRGTLIAAVVLGLVWVLVRVLDPAPVAPDEPMQPAIFRFEKQDMVRVEITRPTDSIVMAETDDGWIIEGHELVASRSMVNRVRHQLHDLTARATVVNGADDPALYGLGSQAIEVQVRFRDGSDIRFRAGDPNPSSVSYYVQPLPGDVVYTVKKSAMDYYSMTLDDFRERRFASFDAKDADGLEADLPGGARLRFQRTGERDWEMLEPIEMGASRDSVRSLLGRVSALKVRDFVADVRDQPEDRLAQWGLDQPRARITVHFASREPITLLVGDDVPDSPDEDRAYMALEGEGIVVTARSGLMEDYVDDPAGFRLRRFMRVNHNEVVRTHVVLQPDEDDDLEGDVTMRLLSDQWQWEDGTPVPGSTPERVALRAAEVKAEEFIDDQPASLARYGLDAPRARVTLGTEEGESRTLLIGGKGPPRILPEDREVERYYAAVEGEPAVYLVDRGALEVARDAVREHKRKAGKDEEKLERREAMDAAREETSP